MIEKIQKQIEIARNEKEDFDKAQDALKEARCLIDELEKVAISLRKEARDVMQDVFNHFKDSGYVKFL